MKRLFQSSFFSAACALSGLVCAMIVAGVRWPSGGAITLCAIGLITAGSLARWLAVRSHLPVSVFASGLGAIAACFFAGATAEVMPPGSIEWMLKGGVYGACFGLPIAVLLGPIGLIENRKGDRKGKVKDEADGKLN